MAKPNQPDETMLLLEVQWASCIAIPVSKAALLDAIQIWTRKYEDNQHVMKPAKGDDAVLKVHLLTADQVTAARMLAAMEGETK